MSKPSSELNNLKSYCFFVIWPLVEREFCSSRDVPKHWIFQNGFKCSAKLALLYQLRSSQSVLMLQLEPGFEKQKTIIVGINQPICCQGFPSLYEEGHWFDQVNTSING